jgi:hypothetical protein
VIVASYNVPLPHHFPTTSPPLPHHFPTAPHPEKVSGCMHEFAIRVVFIFLISKAIKKFKEMKELCTVFSFIFH